MSDLELALQYAPILHFDEKETIPLRAVGYTVFWQSGKSDSFPMRNIHAEEGRSFVIEYAYYWDYDIQHMYDLEHIWVMVGKDGKAFRADGSFHGGFIPLGITSGPALTGSHIHAFAQPGKHAFVGNGELFRGFEKLILDSCTLHAGGGVLIGGPFAGSFVPTQEDHEASRWYICKYLSFEPSFRFREEAPGDENTCHGRN